MSFIEQFKISSVQNRWYSLNSSCWGLLSPHPPAHTSGCSPNPLSPTQLEAIKRKKTPSHPLIVSSPHRWTPLDANKVSTSFSRPRFDSLARKQCFHPLRSISEMYKWFAHKYYCISGSSNQICSDWICLRSVRAWKSAEHLPRLKSYLCFYQTHFWGVVCDIWVKLHRISLSFIYGIADIHAANEGAYVSAASNHLTDHKYFLVVQQAWKILHTWRGTACCTTCCVSAVGSAVSATVLAKACMTFKHH